MASSVCIGRPPSCGRRTASASRAIPMKIAQRSLGGGFAKHFNLGVMVQLVGGVALAVQAHVAALDALGINELALIGLDIILVLAGAQTKFVAAVVIVNGGDILAERGVVGDLH